MSPEPNGKKPAATYLRRSTDRQEKSLDDQRRELKRHAEEHDFHIVAEFVDDGVSGTSGETRKGFLAMVNAAKAPGCRWKHLLTWAVSRFGRMTSDEAGHYRWLLAKAGVEVIYTSEGFTGSSSDRFLRFFKQESAREESVSLSRAVVRGLVSLADEGWWAGGQSPYGYDLGTYDSRGKLFQIVRNTGEGEKLVLDPDGNVQRTVARGHKVKASRSEHVRLHPSLPERVAVVRRIFELYTRSPGLGCRAIAVRLNREGIVSPKGTGWGLSSIRALLLNNAYVGRVVWNRRAMGKFHRIADRREVERDGCGKRRLEWNSPADWLVHEGTHEPLIDPATFEKAQRLMKERGDPAHAAGFLTGRARVSTYLMSGLLKCGACGGSMFGHTTWKSERRKDGSRVGTSYYVCSAAIMKGKAICPPVRLLQSAVDEFVMELVAKRIEAFLGKKGRATLRALIEKELESSGQDRRPEIRRLTARLVEIAKKTDTVIDLAATSPEHRDLLNERLGRLRLERREAEGRLRELESAAVQTVKADDIVKSLLAGLADARRLFAQGTMEERKRVVRAFVESLTVVGSKRSGELRLKKLPALEALSFSSVESLAGVRYEAQQIKRWKPELVLLRFTARGTALVPARTARETRQTPVFAAAAGA
jgi:DNA invertase Pin-like site-specific DNA recombinase